ncbi:MAG: FAD-dependent oxidoreductase, partial [Candidatus Udaeobacter sp.]
DPRERERLLTFVVAGGGFSGVECIAEIHDFLTHAVKSYPSLKPSDIRSILLQSGEHILPEMKAPLARFAHELLERRGVEIRVNTRLVSVSERLAVVKHKKSEQTESIASRTVVATVPVEPHPLLADLPVTKTSGRIKVNSYLHRDDAPNVWAVGDCAAIPLGKDRLAPPTAQHALREARQCAQNIVARMRGTPLKTFDFSTLGSLCSLGRRSAVADVFGVKLSGLLAWILWRLVYLAKFPGLDRKARILADWTMDIFLPRDISQVRIFRNAQVLREHFEPGETIFCEGDFGDRIYFVIEGEAEVELNGEMLDVVGPGGVIGEIALLVDSPRTATVRARTAMNLASVSRETFHTMVSHFPGVKAAMEEILGRRLAAHPLRPLLAETDAKPVPSE